MRVALDADPAEIAAAVRTHLRTVEAKTTSARAAAERILASLAPNQTTVALGGAELASALRQVTSAAVSPASHVTHREPVDDELRAALECVLIELAADEVTFVATDRYWLVVRRLQPVDFGGAGTRVLVPALELAGLIRWVAGAEVVRFETGPRGTAIVRDGEVREIAVVSAGYPAYQGILDGLTPPVCRVVVDRAALRAALEGREIVAFDIDSGELRIDGEVKLDVIGSGSIRIGFTASLLAAALEASVGPDVLLEICAPDRPVVVRSADQGTFTTLVMPVRLDG